MISESHHLQNVIPVILGPTAVGKTEIALKLASEFGFEIISCDSRQVYKHMDIGTAKPSPDQLSLVRHWLVDIKDPGGLYSAFDFARDATTAIATIRASGKGALVCGGTGLYYQALSEGLGPAIESDPHLRASLTARAQQEGSSVLHNELAQVDPESANRIHPNDAQRIIRALAVFNQTGKPLSVLRSRSTLPACDLKFRVILLGMEREALYRRINDRVDRMIGAGLWDEFGALRERGYTRESPGMHCVGYQELFGVESEEMALAQAADLIKRNTRRFAKRQMTWFRNQVEGYSFNALESYAAVREYFAANFAPETKATKQR